MSVIEPKPARINQHRPIIGVALLNKVMGELQQLINKITKTNYFILPVRLQTHSGPLLEAKVNCVASCRKVMLVWELSN